MRGRSIVESALTEDTAYSYNISKNSKKPTASMSSVALRDHPLR
jgi:hypothetical protein